MPMLHLGLLLAGGFIGGFFGAAVGSAGLISLPILLLLGFSPHAAVATTRPAAVILEFISAARYAREGKLSETQLSHAVFLGLFGAAGSVIGAYIIGSVSEQTLRLLFTVVLGSMALFLFFRDSWGMRERPERQKHIALLAVTTALVGMYGGFFGFTFGTLMTIVLIAFGHTFLQAAVDSRVIGILTSVAAAAVFASQGTVSWPHALALGVGFGAGGWMGAGVSAHRGSRYVRMLLIGVVAVSIGKLLWDFASGG